MPGFEYRRATWPEVCELGPQGWRLVPVPPIVEMRQVLGQMQAGEPLYVVERQVAAVPVTEDNARRIGQSLRSFLPEPM